MAGHPEAGLCFTVYSMLAKLVWVLVGRLTSCPGKNKDTVIIIPVNLFAIPLTGDLCFSHEAFRPPATF